MREIIAPLLPHLFRRKKKKKETLMKGFENIWKLIRQLKNKLAMITNCKSFWIIESRSNDAPLLLYSFCLNLFESGRIMSFGSKL